MATSITKLRKRDGRLVDFDGQKIANAINKAFQATYKPNHEDAARELAREVVSVLEVEGTEIPDVEHVQDIVEKVLMDNGYVQTAKAYILYRNERSRSREMNTRLMKLYEDITFSDAGDSAAGADTPMGAMFRYGSEGAKQFFQMFLLKPEHARAHREGDIHIHDLDFYALSTDSCQIDIQRLLTGGFSAGGCRLEEPVGIAARAALAAIAIQANQNDQHGSQSIANFDYGMADGVRQTFAAQYSRNLAKLLAAALDREDMEEEAEDLRLALWEQTGLAPRLGGSGEYLSAELERLEARYGRTDELRKAQSRALRWAEEETDRAVSRAMASLICSLSAVPARAGARLPLSAVNLGCDTSPEGRMVTRHLLLAAMARSEGGEGPCFPTQLFRVKSGVSRYPGDPNHDLFQLACRAAAAGAPVCFAFLDAPFNRQYIVAGRPETETAYTGCRVRVVSNIHDPARQQCGGRGCLSVTSINLPRLALRARGDLDAFFDELDSRMNLCLDQLRDRFEIQARRRAGSFPFLMGQGVWLDSERLERTDEVREVLQHGALSVGFVGLAEALAALTGEHHGQSGHSQRLGLEIIARMRARMDEECQKTGLNFSLLAVPAEDIGGRFARMDQKRFGSVPGVTDRAAYTDSFQVPSDCPLSAAEKIRIEAPYHALTNGGHLCSLTLDRERLSPEAVEQLVLAMGEAGVGCGRVVPREG